MIVEPKYDHPLLVSFAKQLPMGLRYSPYFVQEVMDNVHCDIKDCDVDLNDVGAFSDS